MLFSAKTVHTNEKGSVLVISMIFIMVFSALAVSMAAMSGNNVQLADNQRKADLARACAESGFDVIRYWMSRVAISGTTTEAQRFSAIAASLQNELSGDSISNITTSYNGLMITIPNVTLDSGNGYSFSAVITSLDIDTLRIDVTGCCNSVTRTIRGTYDFSTRGKYAFDFGVATKGPLSLSGNIELEGVNVSVEASVYIESESSSLALSIIGNSQIAGDVSIVNPIAYVDLQGGQAGIGGETGQTAIDNHVDFGAPETEFPEPVPGQFESYATNIVDSNTNTSLDATYENIKILANTNPVFSGQTTLKGIVYIETPNVVEFTGGVDITGIVVGEGDIEDNSGTNKIIFRGNVSSHPVTELPQETQFNGLHDQTGTFTIAPGFHVSFGGSFDALCGAIAGNGVEFFGNAGGIINGSVINYSGDQMTLSGNSDLYFNRSGTTQSPAGFVPEIILKYDTGSYSEVIL
ncbi:MAG: pilus assembly PilX N-terminal domain-containing protein [Sedimentisphaerales bacterium]|nr:pilus assembly PilX N-terminal domain-containing protein [Sedimentisphaerales bacterium]